MAKHMVRNKCQVLDVCGDAVVERDSPAGLNSPRNKLESLLSWLSLQS